MFNMVQNVYSITKYDDEAIGKHIQYYALCVDCVELKRNIFLSASVELFYFCLTSWGQKSISISWQKRKFELHKLNENDALSSFQR